MTLSGACLIASLYIAAYPGAASADAGITVSESISGGSLVQVREGVVRSSSPSDPANYVLFDTGSGKMTMVDASTRSYSTTTPEALRQQMSGAMQQMEMLRQQMQAQMQDMPPEQRAMMEQQMAAMGGMGGREPGDGAGGRPKAALKITQGKKDQVNGIKCRWYEASRGGRMEGKTCVAEADALGISKADFEALRTAFSAFNDLGRDMGRMSGTDEVFDPKQMPGLPIATQGRAGTSSVLKVSTGKLPAHLFAIPKDFHARPLMAPPGQP